MRDAGTIRLTERQARCKLELVHEPAGWLMPPRSGSAIGPDSELPQPSTAGGKFEPVYHTRSSELVCDKLY
jgi:hypothetical protein